MTTLQRLLRATVRRTAPRKLFTAPRVPAGIIHARGIHRTASARDDRDDRGGGGGEDPFGDLPGPTLAETVAAHLDDGRRDHSYRSGAADEILDELIGVLKEQGFELIDGADDGAGDGGGINLVRLERTAPNDTFPHALGVAFDLDEAEFVESDAHDDDHDDGGELADGGDDDDFGGAGEDGEGGGDVGVQLPLTLYVAPAGAPLATAEDRARALVVEAFTTPDDDLHLVRFGAGAGAHGPGGGAHEAAPELDFDALPGALREACLGFLVGECGFAQDVVTYANGRAQLHAERKYLRWCEGVHAFLSQGS